MMIGDEFIDDTISSLKRNNNLVLKSKIDISVTDLISTLYDMTKIMMKIQCNIEKTGESSMPEEFSKIWSAIMKMTLDIEYLRRKGY
ncbi:MAG: hypothetical protein KGI08_08020 [Thaumarchaeota archaeon]|nr:hypothetical protein [Nitrososphaerota archaeon]